LAKKNKSTQVAIQHLEEKLKPEEKAKLAEAPKVKASVWNGFKASLNVGSDSIPIPVRYEKMTSIALKEKMRIVTKLVNPDGSLGAEVYDSNTPYEKVWKEVATGKEHPKTETVKFFQVQEDGKEVEVKEYDKTKGIQVIKYIPITEADDYLYEKKYELWADEENIGGLWSYVEEKLIKQDKAAVVIDENGHGIVLKKGFMDYIGVICPIKRDGKFGVVIGLTRMKLEYEHLMPICNGTEPKKPRIPEASQTAQSVLKI